MARPLFSAHFIQSIARVAQHGTFGARLQTAVFKHTAERADHGTVTG